MGGRGRYVAVHLNFFEWGAHPPQHQARIDEGEREYQEVARYRGQPQKVFKLRVDVSKNSHRSVHAGVDDRSLQAGRDEKRQKPEHDVVKNTDPGSRFMAGFPFSRS